MQARMYDPTIGRFLSQDPELIGGTALNSNPYIYCNNNPLTHIDSDGKLVFLAPLIIYAPVILTSLYMLANTPVLQASLSEDISTATNRDASTFVRSMATIGIVADLMPVSTKTSASIIENAAKGRAAETAAIKQLGAVKNNVRYSTGNGKYRMADNEFVRNGVNYLGEVKNTRHQGWTKQMQDFLGNAKWQQKTPALIVPDSTRLSKKLLEQQAAGNITIFNNLIVK